MDEQETKRVATEVVEEHRILRRRKRRRDLTAEKYLIHIDGEGDGQWADIIDGSRVDVPPNISGGLRIQYNLLRPMTENAVAYHTAQDYEALVTGKGDRKSRDKARIDTIWANDFLRKQKINSVAAEALFFGAAYGNCPVHLVWRDDLASEAYEPLYAEGNGQMRSGYVDAFCGDPWGTTYNPGAKRHSVQYTTYERVLPTDMLKAKFGHIPKVADLEGRDDLPSASRFQRIVRAWESGGRAIHGSAALGYGEWGGSQELSFVVCKEWAPGTPGYPQGRFQIVVLHGMSHQDETWFTGYGGEPILLHDGPLPGGRFSAIRFYMGTRGDDILGKPYVADIDDMQVYLNQLVTLEGEFVRRFSRPPLTTQASSLVDDTVTTEDDAILEYEGDRPPSFLYPPAQGVGIHNSAIERTMDQMFRLGGWQAASRGESKSGDPAAKVVALMEADDTIFGPVNRTIRDSVCELLKTAHALTREHMTVPWLVENVSGKDLAYLAKPYIYKEQMSETPPDFQVVSGMGATPNVRAQQVITLATTVLPDGRPVIDRDQMWKLYPDQTLAPPEVSANAMREQRAASINAVLQTIVDDLRGELGERADMGLPIWFNKFMQEFPILPDDKPEIHIESLSNLTQDEQEDPLVRQLATLRQMEYMKLAMQMAGGGMVEPGPEGGALKPDNQSAATQLGPGQPARGMNPNEIGDKVNDLSQRAQAGAV